MTWLFKFLISIPLMVGILVPKHVWEFAQGWKFRNAKPGDAYLMMTRIMSVIILLMLWFFVKI